MSQQYVGGITKDDTSFSPTSGRAVGPALGGIVVVPFLRRAVGASAATGTKLPFQRSFVYAVSGHRFGGASADKNFTPAFGCEKGSADAAWIGSNDLSLTATNLSSTVVPWKGNANSVSSRVLSSASASTPVVDQIEASVRQVDRGTQISINGGTPPAVLIHSSHVFFAVRGFVYDNDNPASPQNDPPYYSSKD